MGYIPPPDGDKDTKASKNKSHPVNPIKTSSSSSDSTTITIQSPIFPRNPSVGLIWGPLMPASDNRPALCTMIGLQFFLGVGLFRYARRQLSLPQRGRGTVLKSILAVASGGSLIFGCGLEISRLILPYDPWYEEAKRYRELAIKNGETPSLWFGAYNYYRPMNVKSWSDKLGTWFENVEKEMNSGESQIEKPSGILHRLDKKKFSEVYAKLRENNNTRFKELLSELQGVDELNKAERLDLILEGKSNYINSEFNKPGIQLGTHNMDSDEDFEMVWLNFEPWDELKLETDYDIRLIPRYASPEQEE
ncbi:MGR1 [Candida oxycetoniae]|uniref:MGR1 n=1 Tax=Candida oxycetoniae TaxID=497107 RepID=A0AAI9SUY2_9ASCO|nr:MGR1 [Candida oxycetoniae]KAI3403546.2 MGR1 [Candida oxycetoniae]